MNSYGRETQIKALRHMFSQDDMQTVMIYGRRSVEKSKLIRQAFREEYGNLL